MFEQLATDLAKVGRPQREVLTPATVLRWSSPAGSRRAYVGQWTSCDGGEMIALTFDTCAFVCFV